MISSIKSEIFLFLSIVDRLVYKLNLSNVECESMCGKTKKTVNKTVETVLKVHKIDRYPSHDNPFTWSYSFLSSSIHR